MNLEDVDRLLDEYAQAGEELELLKQRRAKIAEQFPNGRTEGTTLAIYRSGAGWRTRVDIGMLKQYVSEKVLNQCRVGRNCAGSSRLVPKMKGPKERGVKTHE